MMNKIKEFIKSEIVLIISFALAVASAFIVKPNAGYIDYIDFRTLALLFCLMAVMAGLGRLGVFKLLAEKMLKLLSAKHPRFSCAVNRNPLLLLLQALPKPLRFFIIRKILK